MAADDSFSWLGHLQHAALNASLVVIDEETRWDEVAQFLLLAIELDSRCDCIRRAGTDVSLVVDPRAMSAKISLGGKHTQLRQRRRVKVIAVIGKVRHPAEPKPVIFFCCSFHRSRLES